MISTFEKIKRNAENFVRFNSNLSLVEYFEAGAKWRMESLWHEYETDRDVITDLYAIAEIDNRLYLGSFKDEEYYGNWDEIETRIVFESDNGRIWEVESVERFAYIMDLYTKRYD